MRINLTELEAFNKKAEIDLSASNIRNIEKNFDFSHSKWSFGDLQEARVGFLFNDEINWHLYLRHCMCLFLLSNKKIKLNNEIKNWVFLKENFNDNEKQKYLNFLIQFINNEKEKETCNTFARHYPWPRLSLTALEEVLNTILQGTNLQNWELAYREIIRISMQNSRYLHFKSQLHILAVMFVAKNQGDNEVVLFCLTKLCVHSDKALLALTSVDFDTFISNKLAKIGDDLEAVKQTTKAFFSTWSSLTEHRDAISFIEKCRLYILETIKSSVAAEKKDYAAKQKELASCLEAESGAVKASCKGVNPLIFYGDLSYRQIAKLSDFALCAEKFETKVKSRDLFFLPYEEAKQSSVFYFLCGLFWLAIDCFLLAPVLSNPDNFIFLACFILPISLVVIHCILLSHALIQIKRINKLEKLHFKSPILSQELNILLGNLSNLESFERDLESKSA